MTVMLSVEIKTCWRKTMQLTPDSWWVKTFNKSPVDSTESVQQPQISYNIRPQKQWSFKFENIRPWSAFKSCASHETLIYYPFYFNVTFPSETGNDVGLDVISLVFSNLCIYLFIYFVLLLQYKAGITLAKLNCQKRSIVNSVAMNSIKHSSHKSNFQTKQLSLGQCTGMANVPKYALGNILPSNEINDRMDSY